MSQTEPNPAIRRQTHPLFSGMFLKRKVPQGAHSLAKPELSGPADGSPGAPNFICALIRKGWGRLINNSDWRWQKTPSKTKPKNDTADDQLWLLLMKKEWRETVFPPPPPLGVSQVWVGNAWKDKLFCKKWSFLGEMMFD